MAKNDKSIYSALAANILKAITKFVAGGFSNNSSMISQGIHSLIDTINQILLLQGLERSKKPSDKIIPFGALDGLAPVLIGLLLVFESAIIAGESRSLLVGEGIAPEIQKK